MSTLTHKLRRDISRQRTQFLAVTITVFLGITLFGAAYDSFQNLTASYDATAIQSHFANLTVVGGDVQAFSTFAAGQDGVAVVDTRTVVDLPLDVGDSKLLGRVVGVPADAGVNRLTVLDGSLPGTGEVALESHLADHFHLQPGATISVLGPNGWTDRTVSGVVASAEYIWPARSRQQVLTTPDNFGVVFAPQADANALAGDAGPNQTVVYYTGGQPNEQTTATLTSAATGAVEVYTRAQQPSNAALAEDLAGFQELSLFFPILFLTASGMAAYVMITRLVQSQRSQVGILLANGYTRRQVLVHYLGYGLVPGVVGAVPGALAGALLARVITGYYTQIVSIPVTVIHFHPFTAIAGLALGTIAAVLAAFAPARAAAKVAPAESMRGVAPAGSGRASLAERLIPPLRRAPIRWRMGMRGIERNPRRTFSTILGLVLSLVLVLVSWGMLDTVQQLMNHQFGQIDQQDAQVWFDGPVDQSAVTALAGVAGVQTVEPSAQFPGSVDTSKGLESTAVVVLPADTTMHGFYAPDGQTIGLTSDGALVAQSLLDAAGASVGDTLSVSLTGLGTVQVPVTGAIDEPLGSFVYVSFAEADRLAGMTVPATSALVGYDGSVPADQVRTAVLALPHVAAFEDSQALATTMRQYMNLFYAFVGVMLAFGAAMAFALIFNAMSVNIAERTREMGTLIAVGVDRRTVSRLITVENLAVAVIGVPIGLVAGYWVSAAAMASFQSDMFRLTLDMRPTTFVFSTVAILLVAWLSQRPGLAAIKRMDLTRVIKDRSS